MKRIEDPIGLLPAKLILGINKARARAAGPTGLLPPRIVMAVCMQASQVRRPLVVAACMHT